MMIRKIGKSFVLFAPLKLFLYPEVKWRNWWIMLRREWPWVETSGQYRKRRIMGRSMDCDNCGTPAPHDKAHAINGYAWCELCREQEQERHGKEDLIKMVNHPLSPNPVGSFSRPPKYTIPKKNWEMFGYD